MKRSRAPRPLRFERLEAKSAPSSLALLLVPAADSMAQASGTSADGDAASSGDGWSRAYDPREILTFIDQHAATRQASPAWPLPTRAACAASDEMFRTELGLLPTHEFSADRPT